MLTSNEVKDWIEDEIDRLYEEIGTGELLPDEHSKRLDEIHNYRDILVLLG